MENAQNSQNLTSPDISSHSLFLENYLFVQTPPSKFDNLPNSASTPKTHKTIVKYNMEKLGTCRKLSGYPEENGAKFPREFESFSTLHELNEDDEARKLAIFYLHLQGPALTWYSTLNHKTDWETLRDLFTDKYVNIGWQHPSVVVE
jgi:hypothetical protein